MGSSRPGPSRPAPTLRSAIWSVTFTLGLHSLVAASISVPQVLAPVAAPGLGLSASGVGIMIGVMYGSVLPVALLTSYLFGRMSERRLCQLIAGLIVASMLIGTGVGVAAGHVLLPSLYGVLLVLSAAPIGFAIGLVNAVGAQLLFNTVPARMRSVAFSIKQTAVPLGGTAAGVLIPLLLLVMPWHTVLALITGIAVMAVFAILAMPLEDSPHGARRPISLAELAAPVKMLWSTREMMELGTVSLFYNVYQIGVLTYLVSYLNLEVGLSLLAAGAVFSAVQIAAIPGRIAWGLSVDMLGAPRRQLGIIALISSITAVLISSFSADWPLWAMIAVGALTGASAVAWNGMFLAEVARLAPEGEIGRATGGVIIGFAIGGFTGPALFAGLVALTGTYHAGFIVLAAPLVFLGVWLVLPSSSNKKIGSDSN